VFNYPEVIEDDVEFYGLFEYPRLKGHSSPVILGYNAPEADKRLQYLNGYLGPKKLVRIWVLVFQGKTLQAAKMQEALWKGGNKNEFIYCVGIDKAGLVQWGHVISWTKQAALKIEARNLIAGMGKFDPMKLVSFTETEVSKRFVKRDFTEEFSYLTVEPTGFAIGMSYFIVFLVNLGMAIWIVKNEHHDH